jgi:hypothetical protein
MRSIFSDVAEVEEAMYDKLRSSALTEDHARQLQLEVFLAEDAKEQLGIAPKAGMKICYFDFDGKPTKFWRFRYLESTLTSFQKAAKKKELRYVQAKKTLNELYLPPLVDWKTVKSDPSKPIVLTEGELKAACACAFGIPTIGLGGVWCWRSSKHNLGLLPQFEEIVWGGRRVTVCFDSDAASNAMVVQAENALAKELVNLGAHPYIARLPQLAPPNKTGLDDFIATEGKTALVEIFQQASEWSSLKELYALNEEILYVRNPGIILRLDRCFKMSVNAFIGHEYADRKYNEPVAIKGGVKLVTKSAAAEWIKWPCRSVVEGLVYEPGQDRLPGDDSYNLWTGWGCIPAEGDITPWTTLLDFLFKGLSPEGRKWVEQWIAYPFQFPGAKMYSSLVVWGLVHGTGKTMLGQTLFRIYGDNNSVEISDQTLESAFNDWMENKQFAMGDEIAGGDKRQDSDRMKTRITQKNIRVNVKFMPTFTVRDCINYYFTSNHPDAIFLEDSDRRFFIHEVRGRPLPQEFYEAYHAWLNKDGAQALFHHLLHLDLTGFNPSAPTPMTTSKQEMIDNGRSDIGTWVANLRESPSTVLRVGEQELKYSLFTATDLHRLYDSEGRGKTTVNGMARELARGGFQKAYRGNPVPTELGPQKLWVIRPILGHETMTGPELSNIYLAERGIKCRTTKL